MSKLTLKEIVALFAAALFMLVVFVAGCGGAAEPVAPESPGVDPPAEPAADDGAGEEAKPDHPEEHKGDHPADHPSDHPE
ncbi:MAG: hypothetical protein JRF63_00840 [Deltaproteobacteria bacterium]|nr:hypothetical protein [Deltaproteobacteria bacterium]